MENELALLNNYLVVGCDPIRHRCDRVLEVGGT